MDKKDAESKALKDLTSKIELAEDNMILNEEFKKNVAIPYFRDIYKDLVAQSDSKSKGINKITLLNVSDVITQLSPANPSQYT
jgi:hypothetical protein